MRLLCALLLCLALAAPAPAAPASDARVGGGMLLAIGTCFTVLGVVGMTQPEDGFIKIGAPTYASIALGGAATAGLGYWLWVKGGEHPQVALSYRF